MERLSGPLAEALRRGRADFNAKFAAVSRADGAIDAEAFQEHIAGTLEPIVRGVAAEFAERVDVVAAALFDLSLDLFAKSLFATQPAIGAAWRELLPRVPRLMARDPSQVAGAVSNALYNLSRTPGARPEEWTRQMCALGASSQTVADFLQRGTVLAWRCGMPQYRLQALDAARSLPPEVLGVGGRVDLGRVIETLLENPWLQPAEALKARSGELKVVAKVGAFRGFAGQFLAPPRVGAIGGELIAGDGTANFRLCADIYNAVLLRCHDEPTRGDSGAQVRDNGTVSWQGLSQRFPILEGATGIAANTHTAVVTLADSHHLFLIARV